MQRGYLPTEDYIGIMRLNKELRDENKQLNGELISVRVENERLRMEDLFLREAMVKAGLIPPNVVKTGATASGSSQDGKVR